MAKTKTTEKKEDFFAKDRRLKARKSTYKASYQKGCFYNNPERIIEYINQPDVRLRLHAVGTLDDDTSFIQISIEGFKAPAEGI